MKSRRISRAVALVVALAAVGGAGLWAAPAKGLSLAVLEFKCSPGAVAVLGMDGKGCAVALEAALSGYPAQFALLNRVDLAAVLSEQELQNSELFDASFAGKVGALRGAEYVVVGQAAEAGGGVNVAVKVIDVATGVQSGVYLRAVRDAEGARGALVEIAADIYRYFLYSDRSALLGLSAASLALPGIGQLVSDEAGKGAVMLALALGAAGFSVYEFVNSGVYLAQSQAATNVTNRDFYYGKYLEGLYWGWAGVGAYLAVGIWSVIDLNF